MKSLLLIYICMQLLLIKNEFESQKKELILGKKYNIIPQYLDTNLKHILIVGTTGSGKTSLLKFLIKQLQKNKNNIIIINQFIKNDFKNISSNFKCNTLKETLQILKKIDNIITKEIVSKKQIWIIFEEFSFYAVNKFDTKEEKEIKTEINKIIYKISAVGRAYNINLILCLQRASKDFIDVAVRNNINNIISFRSDRNSAELLSIETDTTKLEDRKFVYKSIEEIILSAYTI